MVSSSSQVSQSRFQALQNILSGPSLFKKRSRVRPESGISLRVLDRQKPMQSPTGANNKLDRIAVTSENKVSITFGLLKSFVVANHEAHARVSDSNPWADMRGKIGRLEKEGEESQAEFIQENLKFDIKNHELAPDTYIINNFELNSKHKFALALSVQDYSVASKVADKKIQKIQKIIDGPSISQENKAVAQQELQDWKNEKQRALNAKVSAGAGSSSGSPSHLVGSESGSDVVAVGSQTEFEATLPAVASKPDEHQKNLAALAATQTALAATQKKLSDYEAESNSVNRLQQSVQQLLAEINRLGRQKTILEEELSELGGKLKSKETEGNQQIEALNQAIQRALGELKAISEKMFVDISKVEGIKVEISTLDSEAADLRVQRNLLKTQVEACRTALPAEKKKIQDAQKKVAALQKIETAKQNGINELESRLSKANDEAARAETGEVQAKASLAAVESKLSEGERNASIVEKRLKNLQEESVCLAQENEKQREINAQAKAALASIRKEVSNDQRELRILENRSNAVRDIALHASKTKTFKDREIRELEENLEKGKLELARLEEGIAEANRRAQAGATLAEENEAWAISAATKVGELNAELESTQQQVTETQASLVELKQQLESVGSEDKSKQEALEALNENCARAETQLKKMRSDLTIAKQELEAAKQELEAAKQESIESSQRMLTVAQTEIEAKQDEALKELAALVEQKNEAEKQKAAAQEALESLQTKLKESAETLETLVIEQKERKNQLDQLRAQLDRPKNAATMIQSRARGYIARLSIKLEKAEAERARLSQVSQALEAANASVHGSANSGLTTTSAEVFRPQVVALIKAEEAASPIPIFTNGVNEEKGQEKSNLSTQSRGQWLWSVLFTR